MSRQKTVNDTRNEAFIFEHCGRQVPPEVIGTRHRNHCHHCPWSKHVDMRTGDRREWSIIHRCRL